MNRNMIATCGINCGVCIAYLREKNRCLGCNAPDNQKAYHCIKCIIKHCPEKNGKIEYCYKCKKFPCIKMKKIDKRYKERYRTSLINNLKEIKEIGIRKFLMNDKEKWMCKHCKSVISIHKSECLNCGSKYLIEKNFKEEEKKT